MIFSRAFCGGIKPTRLWHLTGKKHYKQLMDNRHEAGNRPFYPRDRPQLLQLIALNVATLGGILYTYGWFTPKECPGGDEKVVNDQKVCKNIKGQPCPIEDKGTMPRKCPEPNKTKK
ncbi:PREDICTED: uncharacterized protein LOC106110330 [Papilio polytes]|uniref:uncharacterized protein LOC106110330 n=1 Tax=Papilio polytes TaxID=76194 RepID=UPI000675C6AA|nr:PREDICTED: uncharacterized protein LOC106110330 [Papilio polytes]